VADFVRARSEYAVQRNLALDGTKTVHELLDEVVVRRTELIAALQLIPIDGEPERLARSPT
jgi:hypothetical protein